MTMNKWDYYELRNKLASIIPIYHINEKWLTGRGEWKEDIIRNFDILWKCYHTSFTIANKKAKKKLRLAAAVYRLYSQYDFSVTQIRRYGFEAVEHPISEQTLMNYVGAVFSAICSQDESCPTRKVLLEAAGNKFGP